MNLIGYIVAIYRALPTLAVVASDDGLSAEITPTGPIGTVRVTVTGDADLGQGVTPIFGTLDVDITAGTAVGIEVTLDAPVEQ